MLFRDPDQREKQFSDIRCIALTLQLDRKDHEPQKKHTDLIRSDVLDSKLHCTIFQFTPLLKSQPLQISQNFNISEKHWEHILRADYMFAVSSLHSTVTTATKPEEETIWDLAENTFKRTGSMASGKNQGNATPLCISCMVTCRVKVMTVIRASVSLGSGSSVRFKEKNNKNWGSLSDRVHIFWKIR